MMRMSKEKLTWVKYAISPVALVDSETWEETPISSDEVVYINDEEFDEITSKLGIRKSAENLTSYNTCDKMKERTNKR